MKNAKAVMRLAVNSENQMQIADELAKLSPEFRRSLQIHLAATRLIKSSADPERVDVYDSARINQFGGMWCVATLLPQSQVESAWNRYLEAILCD